MIRTATESDAERLLQIYSYYVKNTAISFEYTIPSVEQFKERIKNTLLKYPYFVCVRDGVICGYAYAGAFKMRSAYDRAVETTVYADKNSCKHGIGKELYSALEKALALQNIINLNACIGYPATEDEYLTKNSVEFHKHMGFRFVGEFYKCGYKFNKWYNMVWMEKCILNHPDNPLPVKKFDDVRQELAEKYGIN